jgi:hypothetical protein
MSDPNMNASVAAYSPERLAREVSFAASALDQQDPASCQWLACLLTRLAEKLSPTPTPLQGVCLEIRRALEGDSNDAEHDALVSVAEHLGIDWTPPDA